MGRQPGMIHTVRRCWTAFPKKERAFRLSEDTPRLIHSKAGRKMIDVDGRSTLAFDQWLHNYFKVPNENGTFGPLES